MMSPEALEHDRSLGVPMIPVKEIFSDSSFNSRGSFGAGSVIELAKDVAKRGLYSPVIIRPLWPNEGNLANKGFKYFLMAGFRRHYSYRVNEAELIPCVVKAVQTEFEARDINAIENLQRLDLNIMQEANAIRHYWAAAWTREEIGQKLNKSPGWVQLRCMLLELPSEIQMAAAEGYILQNDIREIFKYKGNEARLKVAGVIRDRRKAGLNKGLTAAIRKKDKAQTKRRRSPDELFEIMEIMRNICKRADSEEMIKIGDLHSPQGNSITTRIFSWVTGKTTAYELHTAIRKYANLIGVNYELPEFVQED